MNGGRMGTIASSHQNIKASYFGQCVSARRRPQHRACWSPGSGVDGALPGASGGHLTIALAESLASSPLRRIFLAVIGGQLPVWPLGHQAPSAGSATCGQSTRNSHGTQSGNAAYPRQPEIRSDRDNSWMAR